MAEKKKKPLQNLNELGAAELKNELHLAQEKRAKMEFQHNVSPLKNPLELRHVRREIARLKTYLHQKEAAK